jgi:hypothetical protein
MGIGHEVDRVRVEVVTAVSDIKRFSRAATRLEMILLRPVWSRIDRFLAAILLTVAFAAVMPARGDAATAVSWLADAAIVLLSIRRPGTSSLTNSRTSTKPLSSTSSIRSVQANLSRPRSGPAARTWST